MTSDTAGTDPADEAAALERAAAELEPAGSPRQPGALLTYMRANYDAVMEVKAKRGLSWPQVAALLSGRGLTKENGSPLDGNAVAVAAARVRWQRNPRSRRKRRQTSSAPAPAPAAAIPAPEPQAAAPEPAPQPAGAEDDAEDAARAERLRAALSRNQRKPFPTGTGTFEVPDDVNWRTRKGDE